MITVLKVILIFVEVVTSMLLIGVILLQKTKDEGLGLALGSSMGESLFGSRAGNVLTKITVTLATIFLIDTAFLAIVYAKHGTETSLMDRVPAPSAPAPQPAPGPADMPPEATPMAPAPSAQAPAAPSESAPATPAPTPAPGGGETPAPAPAPAK